ncbi:MAG TPA: membrane dipeptidase [Planctomycetaceae bacterium]|nr:membrane dipeptidase [Planctomycetaceae bacterium]
MKRFCSPILTIALVVGSIFSLSLIPGFGADEKAIPATSDASSSSPEQRQPIVLTAAAAELHQSLLLIDGHNDLPWEVRQRAARSFENLDISKPQPDLQTDIPRLRSGGVGAQFWSVYVPGTTLKEGNSLAQTLEQIEIVHQMIAKYPDTFQLALTTADIRRIHASGKIASLIGVEGGHSIENSLSVLQQLYRLGARYMTLTHNVTLDWADAANDKPVSGGLSPFGEEVIREMNRLGMLVDLSHVSPETMRHALRITLAPVIYSHSSARGVADHPRNVPDDILPLVAANGGVIMVNFYSSFIVPQSARRDVQANQLRQRLSADGIDEETIDAEVRKWKREHPAIAGTIHDVLDHIEHLVRGAGIDHVGIGSDFDGVPMVPAQLEDVSSYPLLTQGLLDRGYDAAAIRKIMGENLMRAMAKAESVTAK